MIQDDHKESVNEYLSTPPEIPTDDQSDKFLQVLKAQIQLFHEQLVQKEQSHDALHQRYYQSWVSVNSEIDGLVNDIKKLVAERKQDL